MARSNGEHMAAAGPGPGENASSQQVPLPYRVTVTVKFLVLTILSATLLAFTVGRAARLILLDGISKTLSYADPEDSSMWDRPDYHELLLDRQVRAAELLLEERRAATKRGDGSGRALPEPRLADGKEPPKTVYSAKKFDLDDLTSSSSDVHIVKDGDGVRKGAGWTSVCGDGEDGGGTCSRGAGGGGAIQSPDIRAAPIRDSGEDEEEEHLPAGQHLLVDIKNVDGNFLNSEPRL
eukprot:CAMPEP_0178491040 /NCGR_PEP_ID=MMETSP0696-20121128/11200_1 /TAXON_ID=265572 /ORGANISM="Extubocellulus spinifer, Strain CCMP396" /LENGTH=235 /DNA_ID=CAMNT_0020118887 /DNA_START=355 /DNA_END=1059 /DNA_ORIENTATION=+